MRSVRNVCVICIIRNVIQIKALKQALDHGLILEKVRRVMDLNEEALFRYIIANATDTVIKVKREQECLN